MAKVGAEFVLETVPWASGSRACGVAALSHESRDHPMEGDAVVETLPGQEHEVVDRDRRVFLEQVYGELAAACQHEFG